MNLSLFLFIFFSLFLITALCVGFGQAVLVSQQKQQVRKMLRHASHTGGKRRQELLFLSSDDRSLSQRLEQVRLFANLHKLLMQSGVTWSLSGFLLTSSGLAGGGVLLMAMLPVSSRMPVVPILIGPLFGFIPLLLARRKRKKRFADFEAQFPEALNFLSRSMRAGHAFSIGLEMLVSDAPEPLGTYFKRIQHSLQLGSPMDVALAELVEMVPLIDVRFFVSSVNMQQGTGGNLGEILDNMAHIIRERFKLKGAVGAASAHGRITGLVLAGMPVVVGLLLLIISPAYLLGLFANPLGRKLVLGSIVGQFIGYLVIKKITNIKV